MASLLFGWQKRFFSTLDICEICDIFFTELQSNMTKFWKRINFKYPTRLISAVIIYFSNGSLSIAVFKSAVVDNWALWYDGI